MWLSSVLLFFFFQAEDGIRDYKVTGVQTCALPISLGVVVAMVSGCRGPPQDVNSRARWVRTGRRHQLVEGREQRERVVRNRKVTRTGRPEESRYAASRIEKTYEQVPLERMQADVLARHDDAAILVHVRPAVAVVIRARSEATTVLSLPRVGHAVKVGVRRDDEVVDHAVDRDPDDGHAAAVLRGQLISADRVVGRQISRQARIRARPRVGGCRQRLRDDGIRGIRLCPRRGSTQRPSRRAAGGAYQTDLGLRRKRLATGVDREGYGPARRRQEVRRRSEE